MGGHMAGEVASGIAVERFPEVVLKGLLEGTPAVEAAGKSIEAINREIREKAEANIERYGNMGTTFCGAVVVERPDNNCTIVNVGDSRAYLFRDKKLRQVSRDHSYVQALLEAGFITPEEAVDHPQKNIIVRAVGTKEEVVSDHFEPVLEKGDVLLLCSDGLTDEVPDDEIKEILLSTEFNGASQALIERAKSHGGKDNITVILAEVI